MCTSNLKSAFPLPLLPFPILSPLWSFFFFSQANAPIPAPFPTHAPSATAPTPAEEHTNAPTVGPGYILSAQASRGQLIGTPIGGAQPALPPLAPHPHPPTPLTPHPPPLRVRCKNLSDLFPTFLEGNW